MIGICEHSVRLHLVAGLLPEARRDETMTAAILHEAAGCGRYAPSARRLMPNRNEGGKSAKPAADHPSNVCNFHLSEVRNFRLTLTSSPSRCDSNLHFSPPDGRSTRKKAVIRVGSAPSPRPSPSGRGGRQKKPCLVIRENHRRGPGSLQKKCLTASELEKPCFVTRWVKEAIWQVRLRTPFSSARLAPSLHFSPPDGRSTRYDRHDFVALARCARRTIKYACARQAARAFFLRPACA